MHRTSRGLALFFPLALACASAIQTQFDYDREADFSAYRSWAWISQESLIPPNSGIAAGIYVSPLDERRIRSAVEAGLAARGYQQVDDPARADLAVSFSVGTEEKIRVDSTPSTYHRRGYGYGGWYSGSDVRVSQYTEGTLALEFYESSSKHAVWVGIATKRLSQSDDSEQVIRQAVDAILEDFPSRIPLQDPT